jgi:hypothetical protein
MATYEQVLEALRRADAAGNTEDAKQLAAMAIRMRPRDVADVRPATSTGEVLVEGLRRAVAGTPSLFMGLSSMAGQGMTQGGMPFMPGTPGVVFPMGPRFFDASSQVEPRPSPGQAFQQSYQSTQRNITGMLGGGNVRPTTEAQKYLMSFAEGFGDPLNLLGGAGLARKGVQALAGGMAGVGGEFGGEVGGQLSGDVGRVIGGITFSLFSGAGALKAGEAAIDKVRGAGKVDVADLANMEGLSRAQSLVSKAIDSDPDLLKRVNEIQARVKFVTGKDIGTGAGISGLDNAALRTTLTDLASKDLKFRGELAKLYADLQRAVAARAQTEFPSGPMQFPSQIKALEEVKVDFNKRVNAINDQLSNMTANLNLMGTTAPAQLGASIQNLVVARERAARDALSPEYNSVKQQASDQGAILPAQDTQDLLNTAFDLFRRDPWGRQSDLLRLVNQQSENFKALRASRAPAPSGEMLPATTGPDLTMGLDITSLDSLKRRVAKDLRDVRDPAIREKLSLLQQRVDEALNKVENASGNINVNFRGENVTFGDAMRQLDTDYYTKVGIPFRDADAVQRISSQEYAEKIAPQIASSPTALSQFLRVAGDEGMPLAEKSIMSRLYHQSLTNGLIDYNKLDKLLTRDSNNGGYRDILDMTPGLKGRLQDSTQRAQALAAEKIALDDAVSAERIRIGTSFLRDYDSGGVERIASRMTGGEGRGYTARLMADINKLPVQEQSNVKMALRNQLVTQMLDSGDPFAYLRKNRTAFNSIYTPKELDGITAMADVARLSRKIDVDKLPVNKAALEEQNMMQRFLGGAKPQEVSNVLVNGIYSVLQKGYRIMGLIGQANIDQATKDAQRRLFLDPSGIDAIRNASMKLVTKDGKEIDWKKEVQARDLLNFAKVMGLNVARTGYIGGTVAASPSQIMTTETEPFYVYEE